MMTTAPRSPASEVHEQTPSGAGASLEPRLRALCEVSALLAGFATVEQSMPAVLACLGRAVALRAAVLVHPRDEAGPLRAWYREGASEQAMLDAERAALQAFAGLARAEAGTDESGDDCGVAHGAPAVRAALPSNADGRSRGAEARADDAASGSPSRVSLPWTSDELGVFALLQLDLQAPAEADGELLRAASAQLARCAAHGALLREARAARERTLAAERARRDVLSVVVHDLRNPLSAVLMSAALLLRNQTIREAHKDALRQLEVIKRSADRLGHLLRNLADVNRIESGRLTLDKQPGEPAAMVLDGLRQMEATAAPRRVALQSDVAPELPAVLADRDRIVQVVSNLVSAGLHYVPESGTIVVEARGTDDAHGVRFAVRLRGASLPEAERAHLFDRAHWLTRNGGLGVGFDLSVARELVEAHGEVLHVETDGDGATLSFALPHAPAGA
jgi:signal transduction histidine kinase